MAPFDAQPMLRDDVVSLRPLRSADWAGLFAVGSDPLIWAHHPAPDRWQEAGFRRFFDDGMASGGAMLISDARTGAVIGTSRFDRSRVAPDEAEIGWTFLARSYWGGAANAAVKRLMVGHVLRTVDRAVFVICAGNLRSRRAVEKIGGVLAARTIVVAIDGRPVPHVVYAIDRDGFARGGLAG